MLALEPFRNLHTALPKVLGNLLEHGTEQPSRDGATLELMHTAIGLARPWERFQFHPTRADNPFAKVAETLWVLAGRSDVEWLARYLPRAANFSDDGVTWRAGYGPRLRRWYGGERHDGEGYLFTDQLATVRDRLLNNLDDRRAVISLWDPVADGAWPESKDFPCNNWLHFLVRDEQLHLAVAVRSNDAWWGWSGINTFEFSVLQEAMATWLDVGIGQYSTFAGSFHLYERHWQAAHAVVNSGAVDAYGIPVQYTSAARHIPWDVPWHNLEEALTDFFAREHNLAHGRLSIEEAGYTRSAWLNAALRMLAVWWALKLDRSGEEINTLLAAIQPSDFKVAATQYVQRVRASGVAAQP